MRTGYSGKKILIFIRRILYHNPIYILPRVKDSAGMFSVGGINKLLKINIL